MPARTDPEPALVRRFTLPTARELRGRRAAPAVARDRTDPEIDRTLGYTGPVVATSSAHLVGRAVGTGRRPRSTTIPAPSWETPFRSAVGSWIDVAPGIDAHPRPPRPRAGGRRPPLGADRASPSSNGDGCSQRVQLDVPPGREHARRHRSTPPPGSRRSPDRGSACTIDDVRPVLTREYDCGCDVQTPAAIAELGVPGSGGGAAAGHAADHVSDRPPPIDGAPVPVALSGSTADGGRAAADRDRHRARDAAGTGSRCARRPVATTSRSGPGATTGLDVDRLVWSSRAGGGVDRTPRPPDGDRRRCGRAVRAPPSSVLRSGRASLSVQVAPSARPSWLVLGQSQNAGWKATVNGRDVGGSRLVDGYANGWLLPGARRAR